MAFSDVCKVYRQGEKFLVLNPSVPSWLVTNVNGVLLLKLYSEEKSFEDIAEEFRLHAPDFPASSVIKFLEHAEKERLFKEPTKLADYKPFPLRDVYLNITERIYCINKVRVEERRELFFTDYKRLLDEIAGMKLEVKINFTGGEPLTSPLTIPIAEYAKKLGIKCTLMTNATLIDANNEAGNITENSLSEIYNSPAMNRIKFHTAEHIDKCRTCDFKLICGGSCQAGNFLKSGDLDKGGGDFCEYDKQAIIHELI